MNVQLREVMMTERDGRTKQLEQVFLRGSHIRYFIVPDMLRHAPMFKKIGQKGKGIGMGRGRATVLRAQAARGRGFVRGGGGGGGGGGMRR
jgi:small nuclear ribonucleoprotein D3